MNDRHQELIPGNASVQPMGGPEFQRDYSFLNTMDASDEAPSPFRLKRFLAGLLRFWWLPVVTLVLGLGAAAAIIKVAPPEFLSRARLWETVKLRIPEGSVFTEDTQNFLGTQTALLQSDALRRLTLERLRNRTDGIPVPRGNDGEPLPVDLRVSSSARSSVYTLEARSAHPAYAQAYLDALMDVYLEYKRESRKLVSGESLNSIHELVQRAQRDLTTEQEIFNNFQRTNNLAILQEEGNVAGGYLTRLKTQLSDLQLEARLLTASTTDKEAADPPPMHVSLGLTAASSPPAEQLSVRRELALLEAQKERLGRNLRPKHPRMLKLEQDIRRATELVELYQRQTHDQLAAVRQSLQIRMENVQAAIAEWEQRVVLANARIAEGERLRMRIQREQANVDRLSALLTSVDISRNIDQQNLSILEPASMPRRTYVKEMNMASLGGLGGLGLGIGLVFLLTLRDDRFTSTHEVSHHLAEPILGHVPDLGAVNHGHATALLAPEDDRHAYAEAFRSLRSALLFMQPDQAAGRPRVILVASAVPNEGKSTVAVNLARTLSMAGSRVLLVDGDLRKSMLHRILGLERAPGLAESLASPDLLGAALQHSETHGFTFLASGAPNWNASDLLLGSAFDQLLAGFRRDFDYVLIDSSPVFAAADAATLAPKVDGTLFVVRNGFSGARLAREALDLLYQRQARVLGVVFNRINPHSRSYYYYKYADYYPKAGAA